MTTPAQLALDRSLHPSDLRVYLRLSGDLSPQAYTPIKQAWLAKQLGYSQKSVSQALTRLRKQGYLDARLEVDGGRSYRLGAA